MPSKKAKGEEEPVKPLSFYVKDRLELTKQLFSCLKSKQIKSRLPKNIQNKSMERIQQICFDEILGISSKRLLSIINNTKCPADTESDSDIEHISLSEISSDDDISVVATNADKQAGTSKSQTGEQTEKGPNEPKTMLELIELEARARAIRSQLALEPITKIELDDTEDEEVPEESPVTGPVASIVNAQPSKRKSSESSKKSTQTAKKSLDAAKSSDNAKESNSSKSTGESTKKPSEVAKKTTEAVKRTSEITKKDASKSTETSKKPSTSSNDKSKSRSEKNIRPRKSPSPAPQPAPATITRRVVVLKRSNHAELTITAPAPKTSVPPVKLKRNFSKTPSDTNISKTSENISPKTSETSIVSETPKEIETKIEETMTESRSSSPDIITMEQNISTYFISDSDDDEPPAKRKSTEKGRQKEKNTPEKVPQKSLDDAKSSNENEKSTNEKNQDQSKSPSIEVSKDVAKSSKENSESTEGIKSSSIEEKTSDVVSKSSQESSQIEVEIATEETEPGEVIDSPVLQSQKEQSLDGDDDNVVNLMSDTEIDPSDKEDDDIDTLTKESSMPDKTELEKPKEVSQSNDSDDDIVEILHSEDDLKQGESSTKNPEDSETWNQRYLRSSTVKSVLETTKLASKLRGKLAANKKSQKESIQKKKNADKEKQKELTEKISKLEEGSLEQFEGLRESSNSSV